MNKLFDKTLAALCASAVAAGYVLPAVSFAEDDEPQPEDIIIEDIEASDTGDGTFTRLRHELPGLSRSVGGEGLGIVTTDPITPIETDIDVFGNRDSIPSSFDLRDTGKVTTIKNQGMYGTCWAHAAASCAESSIVDRVPGIDLSELHTALYSYNHLYQPQINLEEDESVLDAGGTPENVINSWSQWIGPVTEERMPYELAYRSQSEPIEQYCDMYTANYHLDDAFTFEYARDRSNAEQVDSAVKQFLYSGVAVHIGFCYDADYFNENTSATYCDVNRFATHAVTCIGWDDNYPASNFRGTPPGDGAWLCKNSWGIGTDDDGCFWISYYDTTLSKPTVYYLEDAKDHDDIISYDTLPPGDYVSPWDYIETDLTDPKSMPSYMSDICQGMNSDIEVSEIGTYTVEGETDYEITVYTDLTDLEDPTSGTPSAVTYVTQYLPGYHTLELDQPVFVEKGKPFSVVVKMTNDRSTHLIPAESALYIEDPVNGEGFTDLSYCTKETLESRTEDGVSFISADGEEWRHLSDYNYVFNDDEKQDLIDYYYYLFIEGDSGKGPEPDEYSLQNFYDYEGWVNNGTVTMNYGYLSMKVIYDFPQKIHFSETEGEVPYGTEVYISSTSDGTEYAVNGVELGSFTQAIVIDAKKTITAYNGFDYTTRTYEPAKANMLGISFIGYYDNEETASFRENAVRTGDNEFYIDLEPYLDCIQLFPVTGAKIMSGGVGIEANDFTEKMKVPFGDTVYTFDLTQEGKADSTATLTIHRSPLTFSLYNESFWYSADVKAVYLPDGTEIEENQWVLPYAGQELRVVLNDGSETMLKVPERAVVPELVYYPDSQGLGFFTNEEAELVEYSVDGNIYYPLGHRIVNGEWISSGKVMSKGMSVIPGETLYIRLRAGGGKFASETVVIEIPGNEECDAAFNGFTIDEYGLLEPNTDKPIYGFGTLSDEREDEEWISIVATSWGYNDAEKYIDARMKETGLSRDKYLRFMSYNFDGRVFFGKTMYIIEEDPETGTQSKVKLIDLPMYGDMDSDGTVDSADASKVLEHYASIVNGGAATLPDEVIDLADINGDRSVDAADASLILVYYSAMMND